MSRVLRSILVAVVAFVLAACAGLPTSSDVEARRPISDAPSAPPANVEFYGPRSNADPVEMVKGFLRANGSVDEDFAVARQFLTTDASRGWAPGGRVAINQGERDFAVTQVTPGRVSLTATQWAELDAGGHLRQLAVPSHRTVDIGLKQVDGQWRISQLPADFGPYLSMRDFRDRMYTPYTVYLAERRTRTLVPDQQWFPRTGLAAALARAVLRGAPEWLARAQGTTPDLNQVPGGTRLAVDAVPIDQDGVATVDLTEGVRTADSATRNALWAAMMATLNQVPRIHRVAITVGGSRLDTPDLPDMPVTPTDVGFTVPATKDNGVITRSGQTLQWRADAGAAQPRGRARPTLPTLNRNWYMLAADADGGQVAGISGDRKLLGRWVSGGQAYQVPAFGRQLTRPSFNSLDELWLAGLSLSNAGPDREVSSGAAVWVMDTTNFVATTRAQAVSVPWLRDAQVLSLKSSRDGQRVAVLTRTPRGVTKLLLAFVIRDANGQATALTEPIEVGQAVSDVSDVAWANDVTLAVIGRMRPDDGQQIIEVPLSGFVNPMGAVPGAVHIVGTGRGTGELFVVTGDPGVQERVGGGWRRVPGVLDVVAPGS